MIVLKLSAVYHHLCVPYFLDAWAWGRRETIKMRERTGHAVIRCKEKKQSQDEVTTNKCHNTYVTNKDNAVTVLSD